MKKKVYIKQVLTEATKNRLSERFLKEKMQFEQEYQQLELSERRLLKRYPTRRKDVNQRFIKERNKKLEQIKQVIEKKTQLETLSHGAEYVEKEVETLVQVKVGMESEYLLSPGTILIEDGIVKRIDK